MLLRSFQSLCAVLLLATLGVAQWQQVALPTAMDLFCVDALDDQHIAIGAASSCLFTADGGATWDSLPLNDAQGFPLLGSAFLALHYRSTAEIFGTGIYFLDTYPFQVRRSTNGGGNWPTVYSASGNGAFTAMRSMAFWSTTTTGVAVGDLGRIVRTTNGTTWSAVNTASASLYDVTFVNATTVVVTGDDRILRSTNSGQTWSVVHSSGGDISAVHFPTPSIGFAAGTDFLRSTNGGSTWSPVDAALPDSMQGIIDLHFVTAQEGYALTRHHILHTVDGGLHWEWFRCAADMRQLHFISAANGLAVGNGATLYRTGGAGSYRPIAMFDAPTNVACVNSSLTFTNRSAPDLSYQWIVNGFLVGTSADLTYTFAQPQQTDTVTLVVSNGAWSDTTSRTVIVGADPSITMAPQVLRDTVCSGTGTQVSVPASQLGTSFRLYRGSTAQGSAQNGNGNTLNFSTGNITATQVFHLVATRNALGCGTTTDSLTFTLHIGDPSNDLIVTPDGIEVCRGDEVPISIALSQPQVSYQLRRGTTAIGSPQSGNGGTITFSTGPLEVAGTYGFVAMHANTCTSTLVQTVPITVQVPQLAWGPTLLNPDVGEPVDLMNSSNALGGTYQWNLGVGAIPSTSTDQAPQGVTFTTLGSHPVQLIGITPQGCRDTLTRVINVMAPGTVQECGIAQLATSISESSGLSVCFGPAGDIHGFLSVGTTGDLLTFSGDGDSLLVLFPNDQEYTTHHVLVKYDPRGRAQWFADLWYDSWNDRGADVRTDAQGNVYTAFFHGDYQDSLRIIDAARAVRTINPPTSGSYLRSMVITSFDTNGRLRWVNTFLEDYTSDGVNIELDGAGHVYVQGRTRMQKFDAATGEQIWDALGFGAFCDLAVDATGVWVATIFDLELQRLSLDGEQLLTTEPYTNAGTYNATLMMEGDGNGGLYQLNLVYGTVVVEDDTIVGPPSVENTMYYITRRAADGHPLWSVPFSMGRNAGATGITVNGERVLVHIQAAYPDSLRMEGLPAVPVLSDDQWVISLGADGTQPQASLLYRNTGNYVNGFLNKGNSTIRFDEMGERVAMWVPFNSTLTTGADTASPVLGVLAPIAPGGNRQVALVFGELDCVLANTADVPQPVAQFESPSVSCAGSLVSFNDASEGSPIAWSWSFPGGTPATSTSPHQEVLFTTPGTYPVTLVVSNAAGNSTPITIPLVVDVCTGQDEQGSFPLLLVPNPATDQVRITGLSSAITDARCTDAQGRLVWHGTLHADGVLDTSSFTPGMYMVTLQQGDSLKRIPLLIAR